MISVCDLCVLSRVCCLCVCVISVCVVSVCVVSVCVVSVRVVSVCVVSVCVVSVCVCCLGGGGVRLRKEEPHTKMWGKIV